MCMTQLKLTRLLSFLVNGTTTAFTLPAPKPAPVTLAPTAAPVRETNPWAHAPTAAASQVTSTGAAPVAAVVGKMIDQKGYWNNPCLL